MNIFGMNIFFKLVSSSIGLDPIINNVKFSNTPITKSSFSKRVTEDRVLSYHNIANSRPYAIDILASEGHKGIVSDTLFSSIFRPGIVIDQYPSPNMRVKEGRTVRLTVSHAERMVIVPDLIGRSERSAELDIRQAGLDIDTVIKNIIQMCLLVMSHGNILKVVIC